MVKCRLIAVKGGHGACFAVDGRSDHLQPLFAELEGSGKGGGYGKNIVLVLHGPVAVYTFSGEQDVLAVRLQLRSPPARPAPSFGISVFFIILDHELHLPELAAA